MPPPLLPLAAMQGAMRKRLHSLVWRSDSYDWVSSTR
jgi:hypothetical protein